ncbi:MAG TPA: sodium:solute symporter family protein [Candidatus Acidoferrales bacterium]|nr:sodium:solute symporter family protein [Candidatus Acidoferrales bacterium]
MRLRPLDWIWVAGYLLATFVVGLYFRRRSGSSTADYYVSGRQTKWWLAGTSMVATTFSADTPLVVTGLVYRYGIAGNWLWWSFLPSGMLTVFLFARLWRRSGLLTDVAFTEMRYSGRPAAFLRGFRAIYLGLLMNVIILGWVTKAMTLVLSVALGISERSALVICLAGLIPFTGLYVSLGGLWGVLWTDLFQFVLKMGVVIAVGFYAVRAAGGTAAMLARLAGTPATHFFPDFSSGLTTQALWALPPLTFCVYLGVQWWAFWYPGAEPGGGGYVAQRIFSASDERQGVLSALWFNFAHYALRTWPWAVAALAVVALYPRLAEPEAGYMLVATEHLPAAWGGLLVAGFLAAFMSTLATHLNWGSSYLVVDFYRRFLRPEAPERHYVNVSRLVVVPLLVVAAGWVSWELTSIRTGWEAVLEIGAGTGGVYLLRWYWWRVNAWSEIAAMGTALAAWLFLRIAAPFHGSEPVVFAKTTLVTTAATTIVWIAVTFLTPPEPRDKLISFYRLVRPDARGWHPVATQASDFAPPRDLGRNLGAWLLGCAMVYAALFGIGELCLIHWRSGIGLLAGSALCAWLIFHFFLSPAAWRRQSP